MHTHINLITTLSRCTIGPLLVLFRLRILSLRILGNFLSMRNSLRPRRRFFTRLQSLSLRLIHCLELDIIALLLKKSSYFVFRDDISVLIFVNYFFETEGAFFSGLRCGLR